MPTMRGLGFEESCMLALNVGSQSSGRQDLPRFGALVEVIPIRPACLILIIDEVDYNGAADRLRGWISPKARWKLGFGGAYVCVERDRVSLSWPLYRRPGLESPARI